MKKILLLAGILALAFSTQAYAADQVKTEVTTTKQVTKAPVVEMDKSHKIKPKFNFEKRLNLTEEQKAQAKEIHKKGFEEIKPLMDKINLKKEEIEAIKRSNLSPEAQAEKIVQLRKELRELKRQTREIQMKNMKEFESILTDKQKKELKKIKEEGRKNFEKNHPRKNFMMPKKPCGGCPIKLPIEKPVPVTK